MTPPHKSILGYIIFFLVAAVITTNTNWFIN